MYSLSAIRHRGQRKQILYADHLPALLNAGAAAARGEVLLFLWPDSRLPPNALLAIERNLTLLPQTIGGNFHLKFNDDTPVTRLLSQWLTFTIRGKDRKPLPPEVVRQPNQENDEQFDD
jgi:hypothetical protein